MRAGGASDSGDAFASLSPEGTSVADWDDDRMSVAESDYSVDVDGVANVADDATVASAGKGAVCAGRGAVRAVGDVRAHPRRGASTGDGAA